MSDISDAMGGAFDPTSEDPASGFDPVPAGWYPVQIDGAEMKDTKAQDGKYLKLDLTIIGDNCNGRKLFSRLNILNKNPKATEIARRELAAIGIAIGATAITDSSELLGKTLQAKVKIRADADREPDNEVCGYKALDGAAPAAPAKTAPAAAPKTTSKPAAAAPAAAPAKSGKRPWER